MKKDIAIKNDITPQSYNPFPDFDRLTESFFGDRFPTFFGDWPAMQRKSMSHLREEDDAYILSADLPGIPKEDIQINVSGNILTIHAEYGKESGDENSEGGYKREYRTFHQSFSLPSNVEAAQVEAHCENGRLEVLIPKNEIEQQRKIEIQSGKGGFQQRKQGQSLQKDQTKDQVKKPTQSPSKQAQQSKTRNEEVESESMSNERH